MSQDLCVDPDSKAEMMCVGHMPWHRRNTIDRNAYRRRSDPKQGGANWMELC